MVNVLKTIYRTYIVGTPGVLGEITRLLPFFKLRILKKKSLILFDARTKLLILNKCNNYC